MTQPLKYFILADKGIFLAVYSGIFYLSNEQQRVCNRWENTCN